MGAVQTGSGFDRPSDADIESVISALKTGSNIRLYEKDSKITMIYILEELLALRKEHEESYVKGYEDGFREGREL